MRTRLAIVLAVGTSILGTGCGSAGSDSQPSGSTDGAPSTLRNNAVIRQAEESPREQAELGEKAIRKSLEQKLDMEANGDFNLTPTESGTTTVGSDCYVKTGAEAVDFADQKANILHSPDGRELIFVQTSVGFPLSKCLIAVRDALGW